MKNTLLASAIALIAFSATSFAVAPIDEGYGIKAKTEYSDMEAKRRKPRVPGGSGCDSPRDVKEHPECRVKADATTIGIDTLQMEAKRRKPRVPGGSGCDSPRDVKEHPECRVKA